MHFHTCSPHAWKTPLSAQATRAPGVLSPPRHTAAEPGPSAVAAPNVVSHQELVERVWERDAVPHPNGLAYSLDGSILYVAQIFTGLISVA